MPEGSPPAGRWPAAPYREKLVVVEPHILQGLRPQDLPAQLAQLLEGRDRFDLPAHVGREAAETLGHQLEEHLSACLKLPCAKTFPAALLSALPSSLVEPPSQVFFQHRRFPLRNYSPWDGSLDLPPEPLVDVSPEPRVSWRKAVCQVLVELRQGLSGLIGLNLEEGGGRIALQLGAVQIKAAFVEEEIGQAGKVPPELLRDGNEVGLQAQRRAPTAATAVEHHRQHGGQAVSRFQILLADAAFPRSSV